VRVAKSPLTRLAIAGAITIALTVSAVSPAVAGTGDGRTAPGTAAADPATLPASPDRAKVATDRVSGPNLRSGPGIAATVDVCANAHVENIGWMGMACVGAVDTLIVGTTGLGLRMEALQLSVGGTEFCAEAYVQNIGTLEGWKCAASFDTVTVGTTAQGLRMEAIGLWVLTGTICANAHVENIGWQGWVCSSRDTNVWVGTFGQGLRLEALKIAVA